MNKIQLLNFENTTTSWLLVLVALLSFAACGAPVTKKENTSSKPTVTTEKSLLLNQYKDGKKDGLWREYHHTGQLKSEGSYTTGLKEGLHKEWQENGILSLEGFYTKGKANGLMKWFHEKGHIAGAGNMVDDIRVGKWKICDIEENGFCIDAYFKEGKREGIWKINYAHARDKLWKEQTFKDDKMVSEKCWDEKGHTIDCQ